MSRITVSRATLAAATVAAAAVAALPAGAAAGATTAACTFEATLHQSYGLTLQPSPSSFTAKNGTISCDGTVDGVEVAGDGDGVLSFVGSTENTWCGAGDGDVEFAGWLPRADGHGRLRLSGAGTWHRVGLVMSFQGEVNDAPAAGTISAQPQDGNCDADNPLTAQDEGVPVTTVTLRGVIGVQSAQTAS
jgi:hypothetical protein